MSPFVFSAGAEDQPVVCIGSTLLEARRSLREVFEFFLGAAIA
jgi:hypothetical protein